MGITIGVPKEVEAGERRVAAVPEVVSKYQKEGFDVVVEERAGEATFLSDDAFREAGATIVDRNRAFDADIVVKVAPPSSEEIGLLKKGGILVSFLRPLDAPEIAGALATTGVSSFSMELVPRISRAQKMDALSAMANIAGYKAVVIAANRLPKYFPLLTTAAGTVRPAIVLVLGAGVAGLQAIATAKRLGARVSAYDIRDAVKEQVESLGASFVELTLEVADMEDAAGYAKALGEEKARRQTELLVPTIAKSDVVISTALIPGRPAPVLINEEAVKAMKPGSVIVDLAAPNGGNCALTKPGITIVENGVCIEAPLNLPSTMSLHASELYARTVAAFVSEFVGDATINLDFENEIISGACVSHEMAVVNERVKKLIG